MQLDLLGLTPGFLMFPIDSYRLLASWMSPFAALLWIGAVACVIAAAGVLAAVRFRRRSRGEQYQSVAADSGRPRDYTAPMADDSRSASVVIHSEEREQSERASDIPPSAVSPPIPTKRIFRSPSQQSDAAERSIPSSRLPARHLAATSGHPPTVNRETLSLVREGLDLSNPIALSADALRLRVGRALGNDVVLPDQTVSRVHAVLDRDPDGNWWIRNEPGSSGTFVDGVPVNREGAQLRHGARLELGRAVYSVRNLGDDQRRLAFRFGGATSPGHRRRNNDIYVGRPNRVAVADGVGDTLAGAVAVANLREILADPEVDSMRIDDVVGVLHSRLQYINSERAQDERAESTFDLMGLRDAPGRQLVEGVHVGDGVVLLNSNGVVRALTHAHVASYGAERSRDAFAPYDHELDFALGDVRSRAVPEEWAEVAVAGDRYLLTTDGLIKAYGSDARHVLESALTNRELLRLSPRQVAERILSDARTSVEPGQKLDNITVVVVDIIPEGV